jgi:HSP20 family protein
MKATVENRSTQNNAVREDYLTPEVNIFETRDGYVLELDMPGVNKDGLEVTVENNQLAITGRRAPETVSGETVFSERPRANYHRVFELDPAIDTTKVSAKIERGVLTLTLPKSERVKPRKISVE